MALNPKFANAIVSAEALAVIAALPAGKILIYDGTQPATADTTASGQILAQGVLANPAGTQSNGVITFTVPINIASIAITGDASWFRLLKSDDTKIADGSAGVGTFDLNFVGTAHLTAGLPLTITALSLTIPKG
jgi:hypothetical protein